MSEPVSSPDLPEQDIGLTVSGLSLPAQQGVQPRLAKQQAAGHIPELDISDLALGCALPFGNSIFRGDVINLSFTTRSALPSCLYSKDTSMLSSQSAPSMPHLATALLSPKEPQGVSVPSFNSNNSQSSPVAAITVDKLDIPPSLSAFGVFKDTTASSNRRKLVQFPAMSMTNIVQSNAHILPSFVKIVPLPWIGQPTQKSNAVMSPQKVPEHSSMTISTDSFHSMLPRGLSSSATPLVPSSLSKEWLPTTASPAWSASPLYKTPMTVFMTPHATAIDLHYASTSSAFATGAFNPLNAFNTPTQGNGAVLQSPVIVSSASASVSVSAVSGCEAAAQTCPSTGQDAYAHQASAIWRASLALLAVAMVLVLAALGFLGRTLRKRVRPVSPASIAPGDEKGGVSFLRSSLDDYSRMPSPHIGASSLSSSNADLQSKIYDNHFGASTSQGNVSRQSFEAGLSSHGAQNTSRISSPQLRAMHRSSDAAIPSFIRSGLPRPRRVVRRSKMRLRSSSASSSSSTESHLRTSTSTLKTSIDTQIAALEKTSSPTASTAAQDTRLYAASEQAALVQHLRPSSPAASATSNVSSKSTFSIRHAFSLAHKAVTATLYSKNPSNKAGNNSFRGLPISYPVLSAEQEIGVPRQLPRPTTEDYSRLIDSVLLSSADLASLPKTDFRVRHSPHLANIADEFQLATNGFNASNSHHGSLLSAYAEGSPCRTISTIATPQGQRSTLDSVTSICDTDSVSATARRSSLFSSIIREQHIEKARNALDIRASNVTDTSLTPTDDILLHFPLPVLQKSSPTQCFQDFAQFGDQDAADITRNPNVNFSKFGRVTADIVPKPASVRCRSTSSIVDCYDTAKLDANTSRTRHRYSHTPESSNVMRATAKVTRARSNAVLSDPSTATMSASESMDMLVAAHIPTATKGEAIRISGAQAAASLHSTRPAFSFAYDPAASVADSQNVIFGNTTTSFMPSDRRGSIVPIAHASNVAKRHSDLFAGVNTAVSADLHGASRDSVGCLQVSSMPKLAEDANSVYSCESVLQESAPGVLRVVNT